MYTQTRFKTHTHRYFIDSNTRELVCLCGQVRGEKKKHKYNAKSCYYKGINYDSTMEANFAAELDRRMMGHDIVSWERQVPIAIYVNGYHICTNKVDFLVYHKDKSKELIEVKGMETADYRIKKKLIEAVYLVEHPDTIYTVVK